MAIESSTASPLSAVARDLEPKDAIASHGEPQDEQDEEAEDEPEYQGYGRDPNKSLKDHLLSQIDDINLARDIDQQTLDTIGALVCREYQIDDLSRAEWKDEAEKGMKFALQKSEEKQYPWPKASSIIYPMITTAALQFAARTYPALINNRNVVKGTVWGSDKGTPATDTGKPDGKPQMHPDGSPVWLSPPGSKRLRADRIGGHMSWQLLEEMEDWEPQTDQLLHHIPIIGGAARKTFRDPSKRMNYSLFVDLRKLTWNYNAPSFDGAPRHTEELSIYPNEIETYERADMFLPLQYGPGGEGGADGQAVGQDGDEDAPHIFLEQHRRYDLDGDGYAEPYIVTVHKRSTKVVRIVARYDEDGIHMAKEDGEEDESEDDDEEVMRIDAVPFYTLIPFLPNIEGGSYPMGFGHLLRSLNEGVNTTLNQMFDAGHLQNAGGGFVSDQLSIASGTVGFQVGKYVRVGSKGQSIRDSVFPLPFPGPSAVLFQLLGTLVSAGKEVASIQDILTGEATNANTPATTVLALIEQGMKLYTAIHKRVYRAFKSEFDKLYRLNRLYLTENQQYKVGDEWMEITPDDYRLGGGVEPIADPSMVTDMQRLGRAQLLMGFKGDPDINQKEIKRRLFDAANLDRIDELFAPPPSQMQQQMQQLTITMAMEKEKAELGRTRAAEAKDQTQAFLNLALARAKASEPEVAWINAQLDVLRLHIEATNTQVRAAEVQGKHHIATQEIEADARENAHTTPTARSPLGDDEGPGVQNMVPSPGNGGLPALPGGPPAVLPPGGTGPLGGGTP